MINVLKEESEQYITVSSSRRPGGINASAADDVEARGRANCRLRYIWVI